MVSDRLAAQSQFLPRGIVAKKPASRVRYADYEVQKIELIEEKYAHELRRLGAEVHSESIGADIAEIGVEIASNEYYQTEIQRDISELKIDTALVQRDIASNMLEYAENELDYIENRTQLMLEKWSEELRGISIEVDVREFDNDNLELIASARGVPISERQFRGTQVKGLLERLLSVGGNK
ncbi:MULTISPECIES: hypothetical protein [unclassified Coleofasciculus]|uniref:hypothetical protein n=1 Tax=unclassified Coleofasciculus TaxID=2692782 RepID=UPI00187F6D3A|nr:MULTISPECIES: hypothetical protein [unclassified Coleofasciculus]MBE9124742.1 hypothetical protein [Coleofasciculus sp. LEGE 07081]MBE9148194.1 hypothetical protein [Coleofasciculus sp. LEGE 07092]